MKRLFDISVAVIALVFFSPVFVVIAVFIYLADGAPVFFLQLRVGRNGEDFKVLKFRTMSVKTGAAKGEFDLGNAQRVTSVGRWLRKSKLDELPQFVNVLLGQMSVVGPRPEVRSWVEVYPTEWKYIHTIRPGITDPASVLYRDEEALLARSLDPVSTYREDVLPEKLRLYRKYVAQNSLFGDLIIVFKTIWAVVT